jgi:hypothetical protein
MSTSTSHKPARPAGSATNGGGKPARPVGGKPAAAATPDDSRLANWLRGNAPQILRDWNSLCGMAASERNHVETERYRNLIESLRGEIGGVHALGQALTGGRTMAASSSSSR